MTVSGNNTYLVGYEYDNEIDYHYTPLLWTNGKKESLPIADADGGVPYSVYASGSARTIVGGCVIKDGVGKPALWIDKQLTTLKTSSDSKWGYVFDVLESNGHIYALGVENDKATLWTDGKPAVHQKSTENSFGMQMQVYGSDLYVLTRETEDYRIWMNGSLKHSIPQGDNIEGFVVY